MFIKNFKNISSYALMAMVIFGLIYINHHRETERYIVEPRASVSALYFNGIVSPIAIYNVITPVSGYVSQRYFTYGQYVKKGDLLFTIHSDELGRDFNNALIEYLNAKSNHKNIQFQSRGIDKLYQMGLVSKVNYLDQVSRLQHSELTIFQTEQRLREYLEQVGETNINIDELTMEKAQQVFDILNKKINELNVYSHYDGFVLFSSSAISGGDQSLQGKVNAGTQVKTGQSLAIIGDMSGISFDINVGESNFNDVKMNQPAKITSSSFKGIELLGRVVSISHQANAASAGAFQTYSVRILVPKLTSEQRKIIQIGMSAEVALLTEEPPTIVVPLNAVYLQDNRYWVKVIDKHKKMIVAQPVVTGKTSLSGIQILKGLSPGDEVVIGH